ncbi:unnamed protein product, partial [Ectocarpus sp. 13 AM-2016]
MLQVRRATMDRSSVYEKVVEATKATLKQALRDAPAFTNQLTGEATLQHRIKSPYSMWKKMEKNQVGVEGVFDAVAVRVVLEARKWQGESLESYTQRSEDLCYQAMSVIKKLYPWSQSQQRVKDYVVKPKPNGYQSLHATQLVPDVTDMRRHGPSVAIEFQVRSKEMHQKAEFGLAAHWSYKESSSSIPSGLGWVEDTNSTITPPHNHKAPGKARVPDSVTSGPELVDWLRRELRKRKVDRSAVIRREDTLLKLVTRIVCSTSKGYVLILTHMVQWARRICDKERSETPKTPVLAEKLVQELVLGWGSTKSS